jgi:hypothetical protein
MGGITSIPSLSLESFEPQFAEASVSYTSAAKTAILDVSETGILSAIGERVTTTVSGSPTIDLIITIDGQETTHLLRNGANTWEAFYQNFSVNEKNGDVIGELFMIPLVLRYRSSLKIEVDVTGAAAAGVANWSIARGRAL